MKQRSTRKTEIETDWNRLKETIITTSVETSLDKRPREKRSEWFDRECEESIQKRNRNRRAFLERPTRTRKEVYEQSKREANKVEKKEGALK